MTDPEARARNVERVRRAEAGLAEVELALGLAVTEVGRAMRTVRVERERIREALGMDPIGPLAPLYESVAGGSALPKEEHARGRPDDG